MTNSRKIICLLLSIFFIAGNFSSVYAYDMTPGLDCAGGNIGSADFPSGFTEQAKNTCERECEKKYDGCIGFSQGHTTVSRGWFSSMDVERCIYKNKNAGTCRKDSKWVFYSRYGKVVENQKPAPTYPPQSFQLSTYKDRSGNARVCPTDDMFPASILRNGKFIRHSGWKVEDTSEVGISDGSFCLKQSGNGYKIKGMLPAENRENTDKRYLGCDSVNFDKAESDACVYQLTPVNTLKSLTSSTYRDGTGKARACPDNMFAASIKTNNDKFIRHYSWIARETDEAGISDGSFCLKQSGTGYKIKGMLPPDKKENSMLPPDKKENTENRYLACGNISFNKSESDACVFQLSGTAKPLAPLAPAGYSNKADGDCQKNDIKEYSDLATCVTECSKDDNCLGVSYNYTSSSKDADYNRCVTKSASCNQPDNSVNNKYQFYTRDMSAVKAAAEAKAKAEAAKAEAEVKAKAEAKAKAMIPAGYVKKAEGDCAGNDLQNGITLNGSIQRGVTSDRTKQECGLQCDINKASRGCNGFSFIEEDSNTGKGKCALKKLEEVNGKYLCKSETNGYEFWSLSSVSTQLSISAPKPVISTTTPDGFSKKTEGDCSGDDMQDVIDNIDRQACGKKCKETDKCQGFTYHQISSTESKCAIKRINNCTTRVASKDTEFWSLNLPASVVPVIQPATSTSSAPVYISQKPEDCKADCVNQGRLCLEAIQQYYGGPYYDANLKGCGERNSECMNSCSAALTAPVVNLSAVSGNVEADNDKSCLLKLYRFFDGLNYVQSGEPYVDAGVAFNLSLSNKADDQLQKMTFEEIKKLALTSKQDLRISFQKFSDRVSEKLVVDNLQKIINQRYNGCYLNGGFSSQDGFRFSNVGVTMSTPTAPAPALVTPPGFTKKAEGDCAGNDLTNGIVKDQQGNNQLISTQECANRCNDRSKDKPGCKGFSFGQVDAMGNGVCALKGETCDKTTINGYTFFGLD